MKNSVTICIWIIGILFILCFCECGARKISVDKSKEETKTETVDNSVIEKQVGTNVKTTTETKTDDKNETVTQETIYEPADSSKESFVIEKDGTKVILNNAKKIVRNTSQKNNTKTETLKTIDSVKTAIEKVKNDIQQKYSTKKEIKIKEVDKKQFNWLSLWWLYLIIIVVLYFFRKSIPILKLIP